MFTQCPQCQAAFRITAELLQQARGQVRCGSCGSAFNALDHLSEEPPANAAASQDAAANNPVVVDDDELLETLNQLAGPEEVRIEDTGIEWLVVDDDPDEDDGLEGTGSIKWFLKGANEQESAGDDLSDAENAETSEQQVLGEEAVLAFGAAAASEPRYDDNTPLPDDFEEQHDYVPPSDGPQRRSTDQGHAGGDPGDTESEQALDKGEATSETQHDIELSEPDEWVDLLDEFSGQPEADTNGPDPGAEDAAAAQAEAPPVDDIALQLEEDLDLDNDVLDVVEPELADTEHQEQAPGHAEPAGDELDNSDSVEHATEEAASVEDKTAEPAPIDDESAQHRSNELEIDQPASADDILAIEEAAAATEPDEQDAPAASVAEADEAAIDSTSDDTSIVASQLDDLLEAMGSGRFKVGAEAAAEQAAEAESLTLAGDDPSNELTPAEDPAAPSDDHAEARTEIDENDAEPLVVYGGDPAPSPADPPIDTNPPEGETPEMAAAEADHDAELIESTDDSEEEVAYDETTGEFERAIADAEEEILAAQTKADDADDVDAANEAEAAAIESALNASADVSEDTRSGFRMDLDDDIAALTGNMEIDPDILQAMKDGNLDERVLDDSGSPMVETIIMEGDFVRGALLGNDDDEHPQPEASAGVGDPGSLIDTYISKRAADPSAPPPSRRPAILGIAALVIVLLVQVLHASRATLATSDSVSRALSPVYRLFGSEITPDWNVRGWQFEATNGSTDETDSVLRISSRIANRSQDALPYPLVHISLTDRYEDIVGSKILGPADYLPDTNNIDQTIAAGSSFLAVIRIPSPTADAVGFNLNVCYRQSAGRVRCAIDDFKTP